MIERILRGTRFKRFADQIVKVSLPWRETYTLNRIKMLLFESGLSENNINRFLFKPLKDIMWDNPERRAQRIVIACLRFIRGDEPGFELQDFQLFYPQSFCVSVDVTASKVTIGRFILLTQKLFKIEGVQVVFLKSRIKVYFAFKGRAGSLSYGARALHLGGVERIMNEPVADLRNAAFLDYRNRPPLLKEGILEFYSVLFRYLT